MPVRDIAIGLTVAILWGFNFVVMKKAASEFPPLLLTALRFGLAAFPAVLLVARPVVPWRAILEFGAAFGVVKFALLFLAFRLGLPSGVGSIVLQLHVFFAIALSALLLNERPSATQKCGLALGLVGVSVVALGELAASPAIPLLLTAAAGFAWALSSIVLKRLGPIDMFGFAVWISIVPPLPMLALSLVVEGPDAISMALTKASLPGVLAVLYLAYPVSLLSTALWAGLLGRYPAASVLPFSLLVPLIGAVSGYLVYGETLGAWHLLGASLVVAGLMLSIRPRIAQEIAPVSRKT